MTAAPPSIDFIVPRTLGGRRLDHVLAELVPGETRSRLQKLVRRGAVRVGGKRVVSSNVTVQTGARLQLEELEPQVPTLVVHYEDEHLAFVEKPAGVLTHVADRSNAPSMAPLLEARFGALPEGLGAERPGIVHRLDRETSGLLVIARTAAALHGLSALFRAREVRKTYLALVHGSPPSDEFDVKNEIGPSIGQADRQAVLARGGKPAHTHFVLREAIGPCSLLECRPTTGRRHQLRVHLHAQSLPLVEDELYRVPAVPTLPAGAPRLGRQALHAHGLALTHPITGELLQVRSPIPDDLERLLQWLRP
jgi:23S rRNA pseudouridine1911/1915/1917 synthase